MHPWNIVMTFGSTDQGQRSFFKFLWTPEHPKEDHSTPKYAVLCIFLQCCLLFLISIVWA